MLYAAREKDFDYLPEYTAGFIALGSPFRGTEMQRVAGIVASMMVLVDSYIGIIRDLAYDNDYLRDKLDEFCRLKENTSIPKVCFFEQYKTDYGRRFRLPGFIRGMVSSLCV